MMITSAQNGHPHNLTSPCSRRKGNKFLRQTTKQHGRNTEHTTATTNDVIDRASLLPGDVTDTPCLLTSPTSSPTTSDSILWTNSAGSRSRRGSTQATESENGSCDIDERPIAACRESSSTKWCIATTRRKAVQRSKSLTNPHRRLSSLPDYDCGPQEITGVLDPFLSLPLELSPDDRMLLQHYLSIGRRVILGTSERPQHDLALDMASRQMQHCPIHVLACINISEWIICVKNGVGRPPRLYQRIGRTYEIARNVLFRSDPSLQTKVAALLNLQMMESALDQKATQAVHLQALDHLVSHEGGFASLLNKMGTQLIAPVDLLGQCMWGIGFQKDQRPAFEAAKNCLLKSLATIRDWVDKHSRLAEHTPVAADQAKISIEADDVGCLNPLKQYLRNGINSHLRRPKHGSLAHAPAMFNLLFSICFTLAWLDCPPRTATGLLLELQKSMQASVTNDIALPGSLPGDETDNLQVLHPNQIFSSFYHLRRGVTNSHSTTSKGDLPDDDGENHLCAISIDIARLFSVMPESMRIHLARELFHCAFYAIPDLRHTCFDPDELNQLGHELESFWSTLP